MSNSEVQIANLPIVEMMETNFLPEVVGQKEVKGRLSRLVDSGKLPHALLFYGPKGVGKEAAALQLGKTLLCSGENPPCGKCNSCRLFSHLEHPDFYSLFPIKKPKKDYEGGEWEKAMNEDEVKLYRDELGQKKDDLYNELNYPHATEILIGQVRKLIQMSSITSYLGGNRFAVISPAETMSKEAENSLLKLLEEPPPGFFLCVVTPHPEALLPTIISRCQPVYFPPLTPNVIKEALISKYNIENSIAEKAALMAEGSFVKAKSIAVEGDPARNAALDGFLMPIVMREYDKVFLFCQKYSSGDAKAELKEILLRLDQWLRDIMLLDAGIPARINTDLPDRLDRFRRNIKYADLERMRKLIMEAVDLFDKNVYIDLILTNLANSMLDGLKRK